MKTRTFLGILALFFSSSTFAIEGFPNLGGPEFRCQPNQWLAVDSMTLQPPFADENGDFISMGVCIGESFCPDGRLKDPKRRIACLVPEELSQKMDPCQHISPTDCGTMGAFTHRKFGLEYLPKFLFSKKYGDIPNTQTYEEFVDQQEEDLQNQSPSEARPDAWNSGAR